MENIQQDVELMLTVTSRIKTFALVDYGNCYHAEMTLYALQQHAVQKNRSVEVYLGMWLNNTQEQFDNEFM